MAKRKRSNLIWIGFEEEDMRMILTALEHSNRYVSPDWLRQFVNALAIGPLP